MKIQGSTSTPKSCTYIFEGYKDKFSWLSYLVHKRTEMKDEAQLQDHAHRFHFQHHLLLWWYPVCRFVPGHRRCPLRNNFRLHNLAWWCLMKAIKTVKTTTLFKQYNYVVLRSPILEERNISILDGLIRLETKQNSSALNSIIREKQPLTSSPIDLFASLDSTEKCSQTFS